MEEDLIAHLLGVPGLIALVGKRIKWSLLPQGQALPALALHLISAPRTYTYKGRDRLVARLVQFDCWAGAPVEAGRLGRAVIAALDVLPPPFSKAFIENERQPDFDLGDGPQGDGSSTFHRTSLDVRVWHTEA